MQHSTPWRTLRRLAALGLALACTATVHAQPASSASATPAASKTAVDRTLTGDAACTRCHDQGEVKPVLAIYKTRHGVKADQRTPGCQSCHGASLPHIRNDAGTDPRSPTDVGFGKRDAAGTERAVQVCSSCHQGGKPGSGRAHWDGSQHQQAGVACSNCHVVHAPQDRVLARATQADTCFSCHQSERAQAHRVSTHPLAAGKMACSDCHNPHGSTGPSLMKKGTVNATCTQCHADKRGPFLWEHEPVTDSCTSCHTPHGSNNAPLLKVRTPMLCQSCHSGDHAAQVNSAANLQNGGITTANGRLPLASAAARAQLGGRNCQACHSQTHGSNHPGGSKLLR
jgi:DmsE family decaheme c-type cytochrome